MVNKKYLKIGFSILIILYFFSYLNSAKDLSDWKMIDSVNLIFHEAGHTIFFFFGEFIQVLAGSAFQILVPLVFTIYFFLFRREYYSASILLFWVGQNIINVSIYMGDSIRQQLPLLGGESVIHDWNYILSSTGLLKYTDTLATITFNFGCLVIIVAAVLSIYLAFNEREIIKA